MLNLLSYCKMDEDGSDVQFCPFVNFLKILPNFSKPLKVVKWPCCFIDQFPGKMNFVSITRVVH